MSKQDPKGITRRRFNQLGAAALFISATPWLPRSAAAEQLVTEIPANEGLLTGIQFVSESEKEGQNCGNCILYTAGENAIGKCQLLQQGVVPEGGWCLSWAAVSCSIAASRSC